MWKKYLVIYGTVDWYAIYEGHEIIKARNEAEAIKKIQKKLEKYQSVFDVISLEEV